MRKGGSYLIIAIIIAIGIVVLYYWGGGPTGYVVLPEYENQTVCEDAEYFWYNEACYSEQPVCNTDFLELCLDETNCTEVGGGYWYNDVCNEEEEPSCSNDVTLCLDETNCTEVGGGYWYDANEDGNLTCNEEEEPSCSNDVTLCLDETNCTEVGGGYWYDANEDGNLTCNEEEEPSCSSSDLTLCLDETNCTGAGGYWYGDICNANECASNNQCDSGYECDAGSCVAIEESSGTTETSSEEESSVQVPIVSSFELIAAGLSDISLASGDSQDVVWSISNTGRNSVSACLVEPLGDYPSWITSEGTLDINAGEEGTFAFSVLIPEGTAEGSYSLGVSVLCAETAVSKYFNVEVSGVSEETSEAGEGAPVGGFVIFGEGGLGVGGIIILVFVVLALGAVLFFARRMRQSGKTLRDIFNNLKFRFRRQQQQ